MNFDFNNQFDPYAEDPIMQKRRELEQLQNRALLENIARNGIWIWINRNVTKAV